MRILKRTLLGVGIVLLILQFIRPEKNIHTGEQKNTIGKKFTIPENVQSILAKACYDCHSNNTNYPWYAEIQPIGWWLAHHIDEGKEELNFDEFLSYPEGKKHHKLEETCEMIEENEMPLSSYTITHKDAVLAKEEKKALIDWAHGIMEKIPHEEGEEHHHH